ncbi:MAG TPA: alpha/beta hydrolase [Actinomycetes bacterium]|nr:alpha/beta hydrolase [Actinomycetes bacterium]
MSESAGRRRWRPAVDRIHHRVDRVQYRVACTLLHLPAGWQLRLSGQVPVVRDGLTLDPEVQFLLAVRARLRLTPLERMSPKAARVQTRHEAAAATGLPIRVGAVTDLTVDGAVGPLAARHYAPIRPDPGPHPLLLFLHGGGFVVGDLDTHDQTCRLLCRYGGMHVLAVDYRLAPEHPFPAASLDTDAALQWTFAHAAELDADPARIAVGGDSAGANLAAVASARLAHEDGPKPAAQLLIYPPVDRYTDHPSLELFGDGFFLTRAEIDWFQQCYSGQADRSDPRLSPLNAPDLSGLPPAIIVTAGFDPLRDEGEAFAATLRDAGTEVLFRRESTLIHGFANMIDLSQAARTAMITLAGELRAVLER